MARFPVSIITRRAIASATAMLAVSGSAAQALTPAAPVNPDAELLALGAALDAAIARLNTWIETNNDPSDEAFDVVLSPCHELVNRVEHLEAHTVPGLLVKARAIAWCNSGQEIDPDRFNPYHGATTDGRIAASIVRDLLRVQA